MNTINLEKLIIFSYPLIIFVITVFVGIIISKFILDFLLFISKKTSHKFDDIIIISAKKPTYLLIVILGLYLANNLSNLPHKYTSIIDKVILIGIIFITTFFISNLVTALIKSYSTKIKINLPATTLTQNIMRIIIFSLGFLIIFNTLGVSITPILATLGVSSLAVALALQDTLSNLFSGFNLTIAKQIKVGNYIKLDTGEEGYVEDINWRTTKLRMLANNIILIPNDKLAKAIITNYYSPDKEMAVLVQLGVHYNSDLTKVEKITSEVGKEIMLKTPGGVTDFEPFIRYNSFGDYAINLTVILRAKEFVDQHIIKHEFIKALHQRYKKENIVIPYPITALNSSQEK